MSQQTCIKNGLYIEVVMGYTWK